MKTTCEKGVNSEIPVHLRKMRITKAWLQDKCACSTGLKAFITKFPKGATYLQLRQWLAAIDNFKWERWIKGKVGGDIAAVEHYGNAVGGYYDNATAGNFGTAITNDRGTAIAGNYGTAMAGYGGTAKAGFFGVATAGIRGTAIAGDNGTAKAGYNGVVSVGEKGIATVMLGTASAGRYGVILIYYCDTEAQKRVKVGYIGENGLRPNVKYRLNGKFKFEKVKESS